MNPPQHDDFGPKIPLTVIIPTRDEEKNLARTLTSVTGWADQIVVFDSFSTDRTLEVAAEFGVEIVQRVFDNFATHKNWAVDNLPLRHRWILFLDADERLTPELRKEIGSIVADHTSCNGYYIARKNHFMGRWIRHAGMYPDWQLRLFRRGMGRYEERIVHEHMIVEGETGYLTNPLEHNDYKGLDRWFERHNRYTSMEAIEVSHVMAGNSAKRIPAKMFSRGPERTRLVKEFAYKNLPFRAVFVFIWMYLIRGGFLDGRIGFRYCVLRAFVDYQISLKFLELQSELPSQNSTKAEQTHKFTIAE